MKKKSKGSKKILVADSTDFYRLLIGELLRNYGYEIHAAASETEIVQAVESDTFHLVIVDLSLSGQAQPDFLQELKKYKSLKNIPFIVTTELYLEDQEILSLKRAGITAVANKSLPIEEILTHVNTALYPKEKDLRKSPRAQVAIPVSYEFEGEHTSTQTFNLSRDGMFLVTLSAPPPPPNSKIKLKFWLPTSEDVIACTGIVIWCNNYGARINELYPPGMGIMFSGLKPAFADVINTYVREKLRNIFQ
ncbi:PilZ domain-containing protein [Acidobacteriota bacterium]